MTSIDTPEVTIYAQASIQSQKSTQAKVNSIIEARLNKENTQMAREMLEEGLEFSLISKVTGLDEQTIATLK